MKSRIRANRPHKTESLRRLLVVLLCLNILAGAICNALLFTVQADDPAAESQEETREEIKTRLMRQIRLQGWDPYASDMSIEEFYALMELFDEGRLPLRSGSIAVNAVTNALGSNTAGTNDSGAAAAADDVTIPRTMFLFSGLTTASERPDGGYNPLGYSNLNGAVDKDGEPETGEEAVNYPAGLDPYSMGYLRPPKEWDGVPVNEESRAVVIVPDINVNTPAYAGDVDQNLFQAYKDSYVRRVTAQNTEATILGAVRLTGGEYVYYYLTSDKQSSDVSTTTLPAGQKFIVEYYPIEHTVSYQVLLDSTDGINGDDITDMITTVNVGGNEVTDTWENIIFGAEHPEKTDGGAYSFTAWAPYGYTVEFYLDKAEDNTGPSLEMGKDQQGNYTGVNNGWALGKEPDYVNGTTNDAHVDPSANGPSTLTMSGTFYNNDVHHDRIVIASVSKNNVPQFLVAPLKHNVANVSGRGTSAKTTVKAKIKGTDVQVEIPYDYEDVYLWATNGNSKYDYYENADSLGGANKGNIIDGNVATSDGWNWSEGNAHEYRDGAVNMTQEEDGTYSYQWTFQTNNGDDFLLDVLEINGVGINIPYHAKRAIVENNDKFNQEYPGTDGGFKSWYTEADLADGIHVKVEYLMIFHPDGNPQRVYRITATGARSNVVITGMNLMQYASGAKEFATYQLDGVTGATLKGNGVGSGTRTAAIQYYTDSNVWSDNTPQGTVIVKDKDQGINFTGDSALYGANIRFKLADGYDSPYYLWESTKGGVIDNQGSIQRDDLTGEIQPDTMKKVQPLSAVQDGQSIDSQYIYGPDAEGWYYIRVTTQSTHKIALLTIVARPVRYVVRYVPSYQSVINDADDFGGGARPGSSVGVVDRPAGMPEFPHEGEHDSFLWETNNGINSKEYDTASGAYYDAAVDDIIRLPTDVPSDSGNDYRFVDWVLVDADYNPVWSWTNGNGDSVQVTTDKYGNRILVSPNVDDDNIHHPALLVDGALVIGDQYVVHWNGSYYDLIGIDDTEGTIPDNWVTLTSDGQLAYAIDGSLVDIATALPGVPDLSSLPSSWSVRDANGDAAPINLTAMFRYRSNHITLLDVNQFAIPNEKLGGDETDIYVLRLMPNWEPITNPFLYTVALNWVDAQGNLHEEFFDQYWSDVLTDWSVSSNGYLTVQVIKGATPFLDWIAMHPTYNFWDGVNNNNALYRYYSDSENADADGNYDPAEAYEAMSKEMAAALEEYIPDLNQNPEQYKKVLEALCNRDISGLDKNTNEPVTDNKGNQMDDFWRLGNYAYQVHENYGTIVVWMFEDKGGLAFRKEVKEESFIPYDEFYFTVSQVKVGAQSQVALNGDYKAYPEHTGVYDENGVELFKDSDAWLVTFTDGNITKIVRNDGSNAPVHAVDFFTLLSGQGIRLYVPEGEYTITELGSVSGGAYRVNVSYDGDSTPSLKSGWTLPDGIRWLKGQETSYHKPGAEPDGVSQVSATVYFGIGEKNMVHTLQFDNMTATLSIEKELGANEENQEAFDKWLAENRSKRYRFAASLDLPYGYTPILGVRLDPEGSEYYYYFHVNVYNANGTLAGTRELVMTRVNEESNTWKGEIDLLAGQRAAIVMTAPDDGHPLYAEMPDGSFKEVTSREQIAYVDGVPCYNEPYGEENTYPRLVYFSGGDKGSGKKITVESGTQLQFITKYNGDPYPACGDGHALYILVGYKGNEMVFEQLESLAEVDLHLPEPNGGYQVLAKKDVPLYYLDGSEYRLAKSPAELNAHIGQLFFRYNDDYYPVKLTRVEEEDNPDVYLYDGVYSGIYAGEIAMTLKKDFGVWCSRNGGDFEGVTSLEEIQIWVDTVEIPVSKEIFNYRFEELWREEEWQEEEWNSGTEKPNLFTELWSNQSGVADTGEEAKAKVVNWYKDLPGKGYLCITETGGKPGETFLYRITNKSTGEQLVVTVTIGEDGTGATYVYAPLGDYIVEELSDWPWRYEDGVCEQASGADKRIATVTVAASNDTLETAVHADYTNEPNEKGWFGDEVYSPNLFTGKGEEPGTEPPEREREDELYAVDAEGRRKWDVAATEEDETE